MEHLVGLVEHQGAQLAELECAALDVVHHPPRRPDDDLRAAAQPAELTAEARTAVDGEDLDVRQMGGLLLEGLGHLDGQLPGRREHQHLRRPDRRVEPREEREREGCRLAGAGLGLTDEVSPREQRRDGQRLDRCRHLVAHLVEGAEERLGQRQSGEARDLLVACGINHGTVPSRGRAPQTANRAPGALRRQGCIAHGSRPRQDYRQLRRCESLRPPTDSAAA